MNEATTSYLTTLLILDDCEDRNMELRERGFGGDCEYRLLSFGA